MKTEMEKCLAGEWYDCDDPFFMDLKSKAHHLLMKYYIKRLLLIYIKQKKNQVLIKV